MISGQDKNPATGEFWTHIEISDEIDNQTLKLDEEDEQQLVRDNTTAKRGRTKQLRAAISKGLEGRISTVIARSDDILFGKIDPVTGKIIKEGIKRGDITTAQATSKLTDTYMARFDRRVAIERATTKEQMDKIALEVENEFRKDNDLSTVGGDQPNIIIGVGGEVKRLFEGKSNIKPKYTVTENPAEIGTE